MSKDSSDNGSDFSERKPRREFGDRRPRREFGDKDDRPRREFGDRRPRREFGDGEDRPRREFGDRRPRREFGDGEDRPRREFGDRRPRREFGDGEDRSRRDFGDRRPRREFGDGEDRPRRDFSDRRPRREFGDGEDRPRRDFGDRRPRREFGDGEDRPRRDFSGRRPRREFGDGEDRPRRDFGDRRRPRREFGDAEDRPRRDFSDRRPRRELGDGNDRPRREFGARKDFGKELSWGKKGGSDVDDFEAAIEAATGSDVDFAEASDESIIDVDVDETSSDKIGDEDVVEQKPMEKKDWRERDAKPELPPLPLPHEHTMAVLGGSFDPIHNGHLMIANYIIKHKIADEVLFVPACVSPFKDGGAVASPEDRIEMVKLAIEGCEGLSYSDMELTREGKSYTYDTMMTLKQIYPDVNLKFIIGMDNLATLNAWYKAQELVQHVDFIIYPRPGYSLPSFLELEKAFGTRVAVRLEQSVLPERIFERIESDDEKENKEVKKENDNTKETDDTEKNEAPVEEKELGPEDFKPVETVREVILPKSILSSSEIKERLKRGENMLDALPQSVIDYINEKNLYR